MKLTWSLFHLIDEESSHGLATPSPSSSYATCKISPPAATTLRISHGGRTSSAWIIFGGNVSRNRHLARNRGDGSFAPYGAHGRRALSHGEPNVRCCSRDGLRIPSLGSVAAGTPRGSFSANLRLKTASTGFRRITPSRQELSETSSRQIESTAACQKLQNSKRPKLTVNDARNALSVATSSLHEERPEDD